MSTVSIPSTVNVRQDFVVPTASIGFIRVTSIRVLTMASVTMTPTPSAAIVRLALPVSDARVLSTGATGSDRARMVRPATRWLTSFTAPVLQVGLAPPAMSACGHAMTRPCIKVGVCDGGL